MRNKEKDSKLYLLKILSAINDSKELNDTNEPTNKVNEEKINIYNLLGEQAISEKKYNEAIKCYLNVVSLLNIGIGLKKSSAKEEISSEYIFNLTRLANAYCNLANAMIC